MNENRKHLYQIILEILSSKRELTQKGLAAKLGVNPAAVNRMLHGGRQIKLSEIPTIEEYLGVKLDISSSTVEEEVELNRSLSDVEQQSYIPVYSDDRSIALDETRRHPMQSAKGGGIAVYVTDDVMVPRYFYGEMVYVQKGKPPEKNKDCYIEMADGSCKLLHFLGIEGDKLKLRQFNPDEIIYIDNNEVKAISAVVGRN